MPKKVDRTRNERQRRWYRNHKEKKLEQVRGWQEVNRERYLKKLRERQKRLYWFRKKHKEAVKRHTNLL